MTKYIIYIENELHEVVDTLSEVNLFLRKHNLKIYSEDFTKHRFTSEKTNEEIHVEKTEIDTGHPGNIPDILIDP